MFVGREQKSGNILLDFGCLHRQDDPVLDRQNLRLGVFNTKVLWSDGSKLGLVVAHEVLLSIRILLSETLDKQLCILGLLCLWLQIFICLKDAIVINFPGEQLEEVGDDFQLDFLVACVF